MTFSCHLSTSRDATGKARYGRRLEWPTPGEYTGSIDGSGVIPVFTRSSAVVLRLSFPQIAAVWLFAKSLASAFIMAGETTGCIIHESTDKPSHPGTRERAFKALYGDPCRHLSHLDQRGPGMGKREQYLGQNIQNASTRHVRSPRLRVLPNCDVRSKTDINNWEGCIPWGSTTRQTTNVRSAKLAS